MCAITAAFGEATMRLPFLKNSYNFMATSAFWFGLWHNSKHTSSLTSDHPFRAIFRLNFLLNLPILANIYQTYISRLLTQIYSKIKQTVQIFSNMLIMLHKETSFNVKPTKILSIFGGRGLPA